ncbi:hypothetical protein VNI00_014985 [Paramarasmius palmivorus]|uniref:Uncharacterized protein n=1 Tax=Paramarasmius palmivorus TaxID=297713 RepID=A0AAW0BPT9_9AGAR
MEKVVWGMSKEREEMGRVGRAVRVGVLRGGGALGSRSGSEDGLAGVGVGVGKETDEKGLGEEEKVFWGWDEGVEVLGGKKE